MSTNAQEQALIELYNIASQLVSIDDETGLSNVLTQIVESTAKVTNADHVSIFRLAKDLTNANARKFRLKKTGVLGKIMDGKKPMFVPNTNDLSQSTPSDVEKEIRSMDTKAFVGIPLIVGNEVSGVIGLDYSKPQKFSHSQKKLITLFASQVALVLRNAELISYNLRNKPTLQMHSCFISFSSQDEIFSRKLYSDLREKEISCWYAPADMRIGDRIRSRIDEMIRKYDKLLVILSKASLKSQWVEQEVESALARERQEESTILFPIRLDDSVFKNEIGWVTYLRNTRNIGDFSHWRDNEQYERAIKQLLRDLRLNSA